MENSQSIPPAPGATPPPLLYAAKRSETSFPSDTLPSPELLRSLGRLVRGLSALFWGLPLALVICVHTSRAEGLKWFHVVPLLVSTGLLVFGLWQMAAFQKQERVWRNALDRATVLGLVVFGLSPFIYWSNRIPANPFFANMVLVLTACGLLLLANLNVVLQRLGAMLPDEALRAEIRQFTPLNLKVLVVTLVLGAIYVTASRWPGPPVFLQALLQELAPDSFWPLVLLVVLVLLPLAVTMGLLWKTKEVILEGVFGAKTLVT